MPHRLKKRQEKIQAKRKQTHWREFVMEICSWYPINLYKQHGVITKYPPGERSPNISGGFFYGGKGGVDFEKTFPSTFGMLRDLEIFPSLTHQGKNENSSFVEMAFGLKNGYLSFTAGIDSENILYSSMVYGNCKNVLNSVEVFDGSENVFESRSIYGSANVFYSQCVLNSHHIYGSSNIIGCSYCIGCSDLQSKSYCIENIQYSKEAYLSLSLEIKNYEKYREKQSFFNFGNEDIEASANVIRSKDIIHGVGVSYVAGGRNLVGVHGNGSAKEMYDCFDAGSRSSESFYGVINSGGSQYLYCSIVIEASFNLYYCYDLESCSYCLGCIGLKNKSYCIFNKQYTKEERYDKVDEIFTQMEKDGDLGKFFPGKMNPFYFNDTAAYLIDDSFTKEEVEEKGYLWRDEPITVDIPAGVQTVKVDELGEYEGWRDSSLRSEGQERWIDPEIMKKVIVDEEGNAYRVIPMEYEFLMKHGLPLPRKHRLERIKQHITLGQNSSQ